MILWVLGKARSVAKEARNPKIKEILKRNARKTAIIDQDTRWA
jgi:hypothetical protein